MEDTIDTIGGTYFGSGTNEESTSTITNVKRRVEIFNYLTTSPGMERWALAMGFLESAFSGGHLSLYFLTETGYDYWEDEDLKIKGK